MNVKNAFLNGYINEEVYVEQPPSFKNPKYEDHVFKLSKALYGLKQAHRVWYERLSKFILNKGFKKRQINITLFIQCHDKDILIVQIYVYDIIFGSTNKFLCDKFTNLM